MPLRFSNQGAYIAVVNSDTQGEVYIHKTGLLIQKDNSSSFNLKSDTFVGYYKYDDVETPTTSDINDLIKTLVKWSETGVSDGEEDSALSSSEKLLNIRTNYKSSASPYINEITEGDGSSSFASGPKLYEMVTGTNIGSRVVRQSKEYVPDAFASDVIVAAEALLRQGEKPEGVVARVGIFEDVDDLTVNASTGGRGVFFEHDQNADTFSLVLRRNDGGSQTDTKVSAADFNIDTFDGGGISGYTLDLTKTNLYVFKWDSAKEVLRAGILTGDSVSYCHEFGSSSNVSDALMGVPVRWEIEHTAETEPTAAATMSQGKASVFYTDDPLVQVKALDTGTAPKTVYDAPVPLFSLRLKEGNNRAKLLPQQVNIINVATNGVAKWELVLNATLTDDSFNDVADSFAQFSTAETAAADGTVIASGYIVSTGLEVVDIEKNGILLVSDVAGVPEVLTLRIVHVSGTVEALGSVSWKERE